MYNVHSENNTDSGIGFFIFPETRIKVILVINLIQNKMTKMGQANRVKTFIFSMAIFTTTTFLYNFYYSRQE